MCPRVEHVFLYSLSPLWKDFSIYMEVRAEYLLCDARIEESATFRKYFVRKSCTQVVRCSREWQRSTQVRCLSIREKHW